MTKKDIKLILLVLSAVIVIWFAFSFSSFLFSKAAFYNSDIRKVISGEKSKSEWLNVSRNLTTSDFQDRIILLDFWTYACVNCLHMIPEIKKIEEEFGNKIVVIGVHSGKFDNEKNSDGIRDAIIKYDITHPVVNDSSLEIWKNFKVNAWPTLMLVNPKGNVEKTYSGEGNGDQIREDINKMVKKHRFNLTRDPLPIVLEKNKIPLHVLKFPSKLEYVASFEFEGIPKSAALLISNSGAHNIIAASLNGDILLKIGTGKKGFKDGDVSSASFNSPRGLLYRRGMIYVADTGNHALRKIDLAKNTVTTIAGSGQRGPIISAEKSAKNTDLSSPWDLKFFPDTNTIMIANAGTHQILKYTLSKNTIAPFVGNGFEDIIDGKYPKNSLAQTSGLSVSNNKLYFADPETSSVRFADPSGNVKTIIGKGLFDFGYKNGTNEEAKLQHPMAIRADDRGIYIADSFNHVIRKYDFETSKIRDYSGSGKKGKEVGSPSATSYNEPEDIIAILNKFYVADTNNNRIVVIDSLTAQAEVLNIMPALKLSQEGLLQYLPNLEKVPTLSVKSEKELTMIFEMKKGWKINELGPSFFNLVEVEKKKQANLVANFNWRQIKDGSMKLPKLSSKKEYYLQGTIYYCEDKENALCFIKSYEQQLLPQKIGGSSEIKIDFIYE